MDTPSATIHITATPNGIHEPTSTWTNNPKMCAFRLPGAPQTHTTLLRRQAPVQHTNKNDTLPGLIFKQSYLGRKMVILRNAIFRPPRRDLYFGMWAPLQIYNCRIPAATRYVRVWNMKFEI